MKRFTALFFTNFWGVFNDNFLKTLACFVAVKWVPEEYRSLVISLAAGALVLPYILLSPLAERMTAKYSKRNIVKVCKWLELVIMAIAITGFYVQNIWIVITSIVLMGAQSSIYSPAKYGLIRDIGGNDNISNGMGGMEAIAFLGMLTGTVAASFLADMPITYSYVILSVCAILGVIGSIIISANEKLSEVNYSVNPFKFYAQGNKTCAKYNGLSSLIRSLSIFWWMAAMLQIGLIVYCPAELGFTSMQTGLTLALAAVGITIGCVAAGYIDKKRTFIQFTPVLALLITVESIILFAVNWSSSPWGFAIMLTILAITGGFFKIPLDARIQKDVQGTTLNFILAFFNQVSFIYILLASASFALLTLLLPARYMFLLIAIVFFFTSFYLFISNRTILCGLFKQFLSMHYKVTIKGAECMSHDATLLVLPSHKAVVDPFIMISFFNDYKLQPLVDESYFKPAFFRYILTHFESILVPDVRKNRTGVSAAKMLTDTTIASLTNGKNVIFYPSGHITTDGLEHMEGRKLAFTVCSELPDNVKVIGVRIYGLWGSKTSRYGRTSTPNIVTTFFKHAYKFLGSRREVTIEIEEITERAVVWAKEGDKNLFNAHLEAFYNQEMSCE